MPLVCYLVLPGSTHCHHHSVAFPSLRSPGKGPRLLLPVQGMIVAPELLAGMTDSACWARVFPSTPILRFTPMTINRTAGDLKRIHGVDERVGCASYLDAVRFYVRYMQTSL